MGFRAAFDSFTELLLGYRALRSESAFRTERVGLGAEGLTAKVSVMEAAMATTSVLAVEYGLNARLISVLIGVGVPISLATSYLWYRVLEWLF